MSGLNNKIWVVILILLITSLTTVFLLPNNLTTNLPPLENLSTTPQPTLPDSEQSLVQVVKAVDGDTIEIAGGQRVRYIGVDTPETVDPRREVGCFGREASDENKKLVEGQWVRLEKDISETDRYGRLLRYVYVGDLFVNDYLVRNGFAKATTYPPDVKYQEQFLEAQREAQEQNRGLWGSSCQPISALSPTIQLATYVQNSGDCSIKGNISSSGERIFHLPGQRYYNKTNISEGDGERWFCSEAEAVSAGWRRSKV